MTRLDRYLTRRWLNVFTLAAIVLVAAYLASEAAFSVLNLTRQDIPAPAIALHFLFQIPNIFHEMAPIAALLATILTLTSLKKTGEMTALFASGMGSIRASVPILAVALGLSCLSFYVAEAVAPGANRVSRDLVSRKSGPGASVVGNERIWLLEGDRVIHIAAVQEKGTVLAEPTILQFEGIGFRRLSLRVDASRARWENGTWVADEATLRRFRDGQVAETEVLNSARLPVRIKPEEFYQVRRKPEEMNRSELKDYIRNLKSAGLPSLVHEVSVHQKLSDSILPLVFAVIAIPVGFLVPIRGGVPAGIGLSILLILAFWSLYSLFLSLGYAGTASPAAAAWASQALFLALGLCALGLARRPRLH